MVQHQASIKTVYKKLERNEPFTENERNGLSVKEQALIRGIQLRDKSDKNTAKETYVKYLNKGEKATKSLSSSVRRYIKSKYPKHGGRIEHKVDEFERAKPKGEVKKENRKEVVKFISDTSNRERNEKTYVRVKNASDRYPNASLQELRHGVNSQWSQEYRLKHGLNRNYK